MIWQIPVPTQECSSQIEGTPIETGCFLGLYVCGANSSLTFSKANKLRIDRSYSWEVHILQTDQTAVHFS